MSWTFNSTGGHPVGDNGETFANEFRCSPSQPFIRESEQARMRIHRKRCLRSKAVQSFGATGETRKNCK